MAFIAEQEKLRRIQQNYGIGETNRVAPARRFSGGSYNMVEKPAPTRCQPVLPNLSLYNFIDNDYLFMCHFIYKRIRPTPNMRANYQTLYQQ
jgi:hypothetical protein